VPVRAGTLQLRTSHRPSLNPVQPGTQRGIGNDFIKTSNPKPRTLCPSPARAEPRVPRRQAVHRRNTRLPFVPPKPNELETATFIREDLGLLGT